jgi:hypothetical protein
VEVVVGWEKVLLGRCVGLDEEVGRSVELTGADEELTGADEDPPDGELEEPPDGVLAEEEPAEEETGGTVPPEHNTVAFSNATSVWA